MFVCEMKRTTLILEDACMDGVRELARQEHREISRLVNELLAEGLQQRRMAKPRVCELRAFRMGQPKVKLADSDAIEAAMEN